MNRLLFCIMSLLLFHTALAQGISPFNRHSLQPDTLGSGFVFLVGGHLHGASHNSSGFPAASLLANLDSINRQGAGFFISLGDLFLDVDDYYIENYRNSFFNRLEMPLFNAVGNHDLSGRHYGKYFGNTFFHFVHHNSMFIFLDTEMNDGRIKGPQLEFLKNTLSEASQSAEIKNVFISSHRPIWAENNPRYQELFRNNTRTKIGTNNFEDVVLPLLETALNHKQVYWFSGSMGPGPASFFYDKPGGHITYINTAIRDLKRDAILKVNVGKTVEVEFNTISLTGQELMDLQAYNIDYWKSYMHLAEAKFNFRLLPLYVFQMLMHWYFWIGIIAGSAIFGILVLLKRRLLP